MLGSNLQKQLVFLCAGLAVLLIAYVMLHVAPSLTHRGMASASPGSLRFSPDSQLLAFVEGKSNDAAPRLQNQLVLWDMQHSPRVVYTTPGLISRPQFSHDGKRVACICIGELRPRPTSPLTVGEPEMIARVWDVASGTSILSCDLGSEPNVASLWFTHDDHCLVTTGSSIRTIDIASGKTVHSVALPGECMQAEFTEDNSFLYCVSMADRASDKTQFLAWNSATGKTTSRFDENGAPSILPLSISPKIVIQYGIYDACKKGDVSLVNVSTGTRRKLVDGLFTAANSDPHGNRIYLARSRPASTGDECGVYGEKGAILDAVDAASGKVIWEMPAMENVQAILISSDGKCLFTYGFTGAPDNSTLRMISPATGKSINVATIPSRQMGDATLSPNSAYLATADDDCIQVYNVDRLAFAPWGKLETSFGF